MSLLPEPYDFLDLDHGESASLQIINYLPGEAEIFPSHPSPRQVAIYMKQHGLTSPPAAGTPIGNTIEVLRVFGTRVDQPSSQTYWDISSKRLIADLKPILARNRGNLFLVVLSANGYRPSKRYSVETGS